MASELTKFFPSKVKSIQKLTEDSVAVTFDIDTDSKSKFKYLSGQYINLRILHSNQEIRRSYSLCSAPHEDDWTVGIKKVDQGIFSTYANDVLKVGDIIDVMPPQGNFILPKVLDNQTFLFFAAGSGITPIFSHIKTLMHSSNAKILLFYGNKNTDSIMFREELEALKNKYFHRISIHYLLSQEHPGNDLFYGRIDEEKCRTFAKYFFNINDIHSVFLCGPAEMVFEVEKTLKTLNMDTENIHFELFHAPDDKVSSLKKVIQKDQSRSEKSRIIVRLDGVTFDFDLAYDDINILDAALANGADLPFACKGGVCSTCKAKLTDGKVEMTVNYALEADEVEAGYILTCQSHPRSASVTVDFDG